MLFKAFKNLTITLSINCPVSFLYIIYFIRKKGFGNRKICFQRTITDCVETQELNNIYNSGKAELVAIYGRSRIGKTYLVDETFKNKITFRHAGLSPGEKGSQINLIIDRKDNVVNMCEMKFYSEEFSITKDYHEPLVKRQSLLSSMISKKSVVHRTLITTYGLTYNEYFGDFLNTITMEDLFKE